jgi:16S rRNA (uracil1498-N3)-methyltransferase
MIGIEKNRNKKDNMRRFFIEKLEEHLEGDLLVPSNELMPRIRNVLRFKDGDLIEFIDGEGLLLTAEFIQAESKFKIISRDKKTKTKPLLGLAVSLIRRERFDLMVEKAVELGVDVIIPIETKRSRPFDLASYVKLCERWQRIADQALSQCKRPFRTKIEDVIKITDIEKSDFSQKMYFDFGKAGFKEHDFKVNSNLASHLFVLGPEGGFTEEEQETMDKMGLLSYSLTNDILRTETAAFYVLSVFRHQTS